MTLSSSSTYQWSSYCRSSKLHHKISALIEKVGWHGKKKEDFEAKKVNAGWKFAEIYSIDFFVVKSKMKMEIEMLKDLFLSLRRIHFNEKNTYEAI
jgi:hypothetical protein